MNNLYSLGFGAGHKSLHWDIQLFSVLLKEKVMYAREMLRSALVTIPAAGILKEHFCQGLVLVVPPLQFYPVTDSSIFSRDDELFLQTTNCKPTKCLVTFLSSHELLQYLFKTIFHFLIIFDIIVSQPWRFVCFDLLDKITYRDRFQYSILPSFILVSSSPCNLWHKEPDLKYKAVCWKYNVTLKKPSK